MKSIYYLLWSPGYFGLNWNALEDCLTDFNWLSESKIVIAHDNIPKIDERDLQIYLDILNSSVLDWKQNDQHDLEVVKKKMKGKSKNYYFTVNNKKSQPKNWDFLYLRSLSQNWINHDKYLSMLS